MIESGLAGMLSWPEPASRRSFAASAERPIRIANSTLRVLAKIPGGRWRNTCLFRSVAECAVRREYGVPARVAIGVDSVEGDVVAHAWVEVAGSDERDSRAMKPLHQSRVSAVAD